MAVARPSDGDVRADEGKTREGSIEESRDLGVVVEPFLTVEPKW